MLGGAAVPEHGGIQPVTESRRGRVLQPLSDLVGRQVLGHFTIVFIVRVAEFLVGVVGDFQIRIIQKVKEKAQPGRDIFIFHRQSALQVFDDVAVAFDRHATIGIDLAFENIAEDEELAVGFVRGHVARQGDDFLVGQDVILLDDGLDLEIGAALIKPVGVQLGVGQRPEQDHAGLVDLAGESLPLHAAERAGKG